jgi:hypothetical protein
MIDVNMGGYNVFTGKFYTLLNLELDPRFGSGKCLNFELDFGSSSGRFRFKLLVQD